jgi:ribosomal protein S4E
MQDQQEAGGEHVALRYQTGDSVQVVKGIATGQVGQITAVHPTADKPYVVKVDDAYIRYTEDCLASLPVDGP